MSQGLLGPRGLMRKVRRRWAAVAVAAALGLAGGVSYAALSPPLLASQAVVLLTPMPPGTAVAAVQAAVAHSDAVLSAARRGVSPAVSLPTLRNRVRVTTLTPRVLSIRAQGATAAQAVSIANAVARSYIAYARSPQGTVSQPPAYLLDMAAVATRTPLARRGATAGGLGALLGALAGAAGALAVRRPASPLPEGSSRSRVAARRT
jgi:hypothetical protein